MTVTDAPQVSPVAPEQTDLVIDKLNAWRDEMPEIDPNALADKQPQAFAVTLDGRVVGGYLMIHIPLANEIVQHARPEGKVGLTWLPDGEELYARVEALVYGAMPSTLMAA